MSITRKWKIGGEIDKVYLVMSTDGRWLSMSLIYWQAHRGGGAKEAPDNTMAANLYAWSLGGIPEADIRQTKDGEIICLHDSTLARTTTAPSEIAEQPVNTLSIDEVRLYDAGFKFNERFEGERVPILSEVFEAMSGHPERLVYLDLKDVDLERLGRLIDSYGVNSQVLFAHNKQASCIKMKRIADGVRTMMWIGGTPETIGQNYTIAAGNGFGGLDQIQFHLRIAKAEAPDPYGDISHRNWPFELSRQFVESSFKRLTEAGLDLEVFPFDFDKESIGVLLDIGIRWFATDEPRRFAQCVDTWQNKDGNGKI